MDFQEGACTFSISRYSLEKWGKERLSDDDIRPLLESKAIGRSDLINPATGKQCDAILTLERNDKTQWMEIQVRFPGYEEEIKNIPRRKRVPTGVCPRCESRKIDARWIVRRCLVWDGTEWVCRTCANKSIESLNRVPQEIEQDQAAIEPQIWRTMLRKHSAKCRDHI